MEKREKIKLYLSTLFNILGLGLGALLILNLLFNSEFSENNNDIIVVIINVIFGSSYKELWKSSINAKIKNLEEKELNDLIPTAELIKKTIPFYVNLYNILILSIYIIFSLESSLYLSLIILYFVTISTINGIKGLR